MAEALVGAGAPDRPSSGESRWLHQPATVRLSAVSLRRSLCVLRDSWITERGRRPPLRLSPDPAMRAGSPSLTPNVTAVTPRPDHPDVTERVVDGIARQVLLRCEWHPRTKII